MGASSEMHLQMRAEEILPMYDSTFTKKEALETGKSLVINSLEAGNISPHELMTRIVRLKNVVDSAEAELRSKLPHEKVTLQGVEFSPVDGGNALNYEEDPVYKQMKKDLKEREDLLKLAQKQDLLLDAGGNEVPKVSTTPRKSSITIKF